MTTDGIVTVIVTVTVADEMPRGTVAAVEAPAVDIEITTTGTETRHTAAGTAP
jgi:hypothetical protein